MNLKNALRRPFEGIGALAKKMLLFRSSPHQLALGMAIGIFIGIFPTFGFGGFAVLGLSPLFKYNVPAALVGGSILANPFLAPVWIFLSCWVVGIDFAAIKSSEQTLSMLAKHYRGVMGWYLLGNTVVSTVIALLSYGLTYVLSVLFIQPKSPG
jgi:uncharacterized protein (DUF2062 family)